MVLFDLVLGLFIVPPLALAWAGRRRGRLWAGAWLLTLAPLYLPMGEDGFLAVWYALVPPSVDPHGIAGVVHPHAAGHVLGAGVAAILLGLTAAYIAHRHLRAGEPWAYPVLLGLGVVVLAVAFVELVWFFGHGLPTLALARGGFGWPFWVGGILAWVLGLVYARPRKKAVE